MLLEDYRDRRLLTLYQTLTKSDLRGYYEDTYMVELMFALLCLDLSANIKHHLELSPSEYTLLARELIRIVDDGELDRYSVYYWADALLTYMKVNNLKPKQIKKMSTFDLKENVFKCMEGND